MGTFKFKNKYACGAYFNMARDNFHRTIMDIFRQVGLNQNFEETDINEGLKQVIQLLKGENAPISRANRQTLIANQMKMRQLLFRHFPILGPVMADIVRQRHRLKEKEKLEELDCDEKEKLKKLQKKEENKNLSHEEQNDLKRLKKKIEVNDDGDRDATCVDCLETLLQFGLCLTDCRNYFTHYNPKNSSDELEKMYKCQVQISSWLFSVFTASRRLDKKRNRLNSAEMEFITKKIMIKAEGKDVYIKNHDFYFSVIGESYIKKGLNGSYEQKQYEKNFGNANHFALSDFGLLYLCCCFITRPQAHLFIKEVALFNDRPEKEKENNIIQEMLSIYRVRLPKGKRLDKQDNCATVALDMLNELRRCPNELYKVLSPKGQNAFKDPIRSDNGDDNGTAERIRHNDRFPYLALRAIDEAKMLPHIRFQVQLGYYRFAFYDKICIDGTPQLRRLGKAVNGFGRLSAIENERKNKWGIENDEDTKQIPNKMQRKVYAPTTLEDGVTVLDLLRPVEDKVANEPYITDSAAFYNIHNNRIGLYWEERNNKDVLVFPTLDATDRDCKGRRKANVPQKAPLCSLSVRDLPALLFLCHLNKNNNCKEVEDIIIKKYENLHRFFTDLSRKPEEGNNDPIFETIWQDIEKEGLDKVLCDKYQLKPSEIPERLKECLETSSKTSSDIVIFFKDLLSETEYALEENVTLNAIMDLIKKVGYENPSRLIKKIEPNQITQIGIEVLMECKGKKVEDLPDNIKNFVFGQVETKSENPLTCRFLDSLLGTEKDPKNPNKGRLESRIEWIECQLDRLKSARKKQFEKTNRYGTKGYEGIRYGRLAEQLAESMLMWQPTTNTEIPLERGQNKLTGLDYRRLVDFLATYGKHSKVAIDDKDNVSEGFSALEHVLTKAKLLGSDSPHPFLVCAIKKEPENIEKLFQDYMECEKYELIKLKRKLKNKRSDDIGDVQSLAPAFVHPYRERWSLGIPNADHIRKMAANYIKPGNTLLLPDGLFTDAIIEQLDKNILEEASNNENNHERLRNVSFFISKYIEKNEDHWQSFYDYDGEEKKFYRGYELFKKLYGKKQGNEKFYKYMSRKEIAERIKNKEFLKSDIDDYCNSIRSRTKANKAKKDMIQEINKIKKNERTILRYKTQDIVLFLTAKKMLQKQLELREQNNRNVDEKTQKTNLGSGEQELKTSEQMLKKRKDSVNNMKLKDVFDGDALNVTMDYEYIREVKWKLNDINFNRKVYITQNNTAIKNFGKIFRIINDQRLDLLLQLLIVKREGENMLPKADYEYTVSVAELAHEFARLDELRPAAFEIIHDLEKASHEKQPKMSDEDTFKFPKMMRRLICDEKEVDAINKYRISFAHCKYGVDAETFGNVALEVPNVSQKMKDQMQCRAKPIIANSQKTNK